MNAPTEKEVNDALAVLQRDYNDDVRGIVSEMRRQVREGEVNEDDFHDRLHEQIDGHQRVIYTYRARLGMCLTDNPDAYQDEMGEPAPTVEAAMFYALMADVSDRLGSFEDAKEAAEDD